MAAKLALVLVMCQTALGQLPVPGLAQQAPASKSAIVQLPEPNYWKQDLFLVPYQWRSAAEPAAAQAVWLYVSKDRGATWQKISEAKPQVKAFNYRAEGEGEYWFAIRTLDHHGRVWPAGAYQPELRVIVDTTMPRIEELRGQFVAGGDGIEIAWRLSDANLDANTLSIEAQIDAAGNWQSVPLTNTIAATPNANADSSVGGIISGRFLWQVPLKPVAIRATVLDRAGNSATYRAEITPAATGMAAPDFTTASNNSSNSNQLASRELFGAPAAPQGPANPSGWVSSSVTTVPAITPPANQTWPATVTSRAPFRLSSIAANTPTDGITAYGDPPVTTAPLVASDNSASNLDDGRVQAKYAATPVIPESPDASPPRPEVTPVTPFRHASIKRLPMPNAEIPLPPAESRQALPPVAARSAHYAPPGQAKLVGSRTFALEYDLQDTGRWGVLKVELWGTRDGGQTWRSYARDDDHRSPLIVTVDNEGVYGFRIVVDSAGSEAAAAPGPGDAPELWVDVDLHRPVIELTAIERGEGNLADHLILHWRAEDDNLEPRPIALFYSSRPTGPWSAVATSLEDTGEYAWRVDRHVPARFYLRAEARDSAGNLAAYQTREPIDFAPVQPDAHLRETEPVGPTATGGEQSYR